MRQGPHLQHMAMVLEPSPHLNTLSASNDQHKGLTGRSALQILNTAFFLVGYLGFLATWIMDTIYTFVHKCGCSLPEMTGPHYLCMAMASHMTSAAAIHKQPLDRDHPPSCASCSQQLGWWNKHVKTLLSALSPHYGLARGMYNISQVRKLVPECRGSHALQLCPRSMRMPSYASHSASVVAVCCRHTDWIRACPTPHHGRGLPQAASSPTWAFRALVCRRLLIFLPKL